MKTFLRRLEILNFLRSTKQSQGTEAILQHLIDSDYIDASQVHSSDQDITRKIIKSQFRLIQRDLVFLLGEQVEDDSYDHDDGYDYGYDYGYDNDFGLSVSTGLGKSRHWRLDPYAPLKYDFDKMPAFMALALSITQKHLKQVLPPSTQHELKRIFVSAESKLHKSEKKISPLHYQRLTDSVEFFQRGQRLQTPQFDMDILDTIYRAILSGKRLNISYRSQTGLKEYEIHPFGVAIMLPKLYLVGKKQEDIRQEPDKRSNENAFRSFLIHKIEDISLSHLPNVVPEGFKLKTYLDEGNMDVLLDSADNKRYTLELELNISQHSNLISDLSESPISAQQSLTQTSDNRWLLQAEIKRTIQLRNWLLSLGPQAKILAPEKIRDDLLQALDAMQNNYA